MALRPVEVLSLIPARGRSKSLPRKNVRPLGGFPLLAWSIAAARGSSHVSRILLSTDDREIREVGLAFGAEAPFLRPADIAEDDTPDLPVFLHALDWLEKEEGYRPDLVVQLRPTSPLRPPDLVDRAVVTLMAHPEADSLRAVCPPSQNPYKMWRTAGPYLEPLLHDGGPEAYNKARQSLPPTLWQTGHIDVVRSETLLKKGSMTGALIVPLLVDPSYAIDIDTAAQWEMAEWVATRSAMALVRPEGKAVGVGRE